MVCRVDVTVQAHNVMMQAICKHNLISGYFRAFRSSANMIDLAGFFVDYLESVLAHDAVFLVTPMHYCTGLVPTVINFVTFSQSHR